MFTQKKEGSAAALRVDQKHVTMADVGRGFLNHVQSSTTGKVVAAKDEKYEADAAFYDWLPKNPKDIIAKELQTTPHANRFRELKSKLKAITDEKNDRIGINIQLRNLLKELFDRALFDFGIRPHEIQMELCIAGSLAKSFATPYSDIDSFLLLGDGILGNANQLEKIKQITERLYHLSQCLHESTKQFMFDPFGVNIKTLCGNVPDVYQVICKRESLGRHEDISALIVSVCNGISVFGNDQLLRNLQSFLDRFEASYYFKKAIEEYGGPKHLKDCINVKSDILRPLDFMIQGFRKQCGLSLQEFSEPKKLLNELVNRRVISDSVRNLIEYIQLKAYQIRRMLHQQNEREHDDVENPKKEITDLIGLVGWLRGSLDCFLKNKSKYTTFDLQGHQYLSSGDEKIREERLARVELLRTGVYGQLRDQQVLPVHDVKAVMEPDSRVVLELKKILAGVPEGLTAVELKEIAAYFKTHAKAAIKTTAKADEKLEDAKLTPNVAVVVNAMKAMSNKTGVDILSRIGNEADALTKEKVPSLKVSSVTRIFNMVPAPYTAEEAKSIANSLKQRLEQMIGQEDQPDFMKKFRQAIKTWLNEILFKYVFPEMLDSHGKIKPQIWQLLCFDELVGKQEALDKSVLDQMTFGLLSGYVSMAMGALPEISSFFATLHGDKRVKFSTEQRELGIGYQNLFSKALHAFMELKNKNVGNSEEINFEQEVTFIEEMVISFSISSMKKALVKKAEVLEGDTRRLLEEAPKKLTEMTILNLRIARVFFEQNKSEFYAVVFVACCEIENTLQEKYKKLQHAHEVLLKDPASHVTKENRVEKNFLYFRAICDIQDFKRGKLSFAQLLVCLDTYVNYAEAIPNVDGASELVHLQTESTAVLKQVRDQLKKLEPLESQLKPNSSSQPAIVATAAAFRK